MQHAYYPLFCYLYTCTVLRWNYEDRDITYDKNHKGRKNKWYSWC